MDNTRTVDSTFAKQLKIVMRERSLTNSDIAKLMGVSRSMITHYLNLTKSPKMNTVKTLAIALDINPAFFFNMEQEQHTTPSFASAVKSATTQIPLFASISCGDLSSIDNNLIGQIEIPERLVKRYGHDNLFAVKTKGDSMNKLVLEGHLAIFAKNTEWHNGDAVAVLVNGDDATLKNITRTRASIILEPASYNPEHQPVLINCNEVDCDGYVTVLGKFVGSMNFEQ